MFLDGREGEAPSRWGCRQRNRLVAFGIVGLGFGAAGKTVGSICGEKSSEKGYGVEGEKKNLDQKFLCHPDFFRSFQLAKRAAVSGTKREAPGKSVQDFPSPQSVEGAVPGLWPYSGREPHLLPLALLLSDSAPGDAPQPPPKRDLETLLNHLGVPHVQVRALFDLVPSKRDGQLMGVSLADGGQGLRWFKFKAESDERSKVFMYLICLFQFLCPPPRLPLPIPSSAWDLGSSRGRSHLRCSGEVGGRLVHSHRGHGRPALWEPAPPAASPR